MEGNRQKDERKQDTKERPTLQALQAKSINKSIVFLKIRAFFLD